MTAHVINVLKPYSDDAGNVIEYDGPPIESGISIKFRGSNNVLRVASTATISALSVSFASDASRVEIAATNKRRTGVRAHIRTGYDCAVAIGSDTGMKTKTRIYVAERTEVVIGQDCMFATNVEIRTEDSHPIYDVGTGKRVNTSRSIHIGDHVWLGKDVVVTGGTSVGSGSVVGLRSVITKDVPNNCTAVGAPAHVVRRNIAWERPMLAFHKPRPEGHLVRGKKTRRYWRDTDDDVTAARPDKAVSTVRKRVKRVMKRAIPGWLHAPLRQVVNRLRGFGST